MPLSGLLTLRICRGDFIEHSLHLANWTSSYTAYNEFPRRSDELPSPRDYSKHIFTRALDGPQNEIRSQHRQQHLRVAELEDVGWVPGAWLSSRDGAA